MGERQPTVPCKRCQEPSVTGLHVECARVSAEELDDRARRDLAAWRALGNGAYQRRRLPGAE